VLLQDPFGVIHTAADGRILEVLARADTWFGIAQVWELSRISSRDQVRRALARLAVDGILDEERVASMYRYRLNQEHLLAGPLKEISTTRERFLGQLKSTLSSWPELVYAALFGSAARNDMRPGSDIDIFLVRSDDELFGKITEEAWDERVLALEYHVSRWTGNSSNVLHLRASEVRTAGNVDALANIRTEGIPLVGDKVWLVKALHHGGSTG
jgi:predicted nucleotidyltransferase